MGTEADEPVFANSSQDLPTELIKAFHSTLEEALSADILLIVSDSSRLDLALPQMTTTTTNKNNSSESRSSRLIEFY